MRLICAVSLIAFCFALQAHAQREPDIIDRLRSEPLTLFDWGLVKLDQDIARAAQNVRLRYLNPTPPVPGTIYNWRTRMVTIYASYQAPSSARTKQACKRTLEAIQSNLTHGRPFGPSWYLLDVFRPKAHYGFRRSEDLAQKLLDRFVLEVTLIPSTQDAVDGDKAKVRCHGRLDSEPEMIDVEFTS